MANKYYKGPVTDHFDGERFFNPAGIKPGSFVGMLKWKILGDQTPWPKNYESPYSPATPQRTVDGDGLRVTMVGHATLLVQVAGKNILTDPVWSERASPMSFAGPKRRNAPGIRFEDLPPIDFVLLTHNHYDHFDLETLARLRSAHDPLVVTPLGNDTIVAGHVPAMNTAALDWGQSTDVSDGFTIHCEPAHHWSARGALDRRMALWGAFVIETPAGLIYHVGDTGFHEGRNYRAASEKYGGFRLANLPFGAYEPRWFMKGQHQNPTEAVEGMELARAAHAAGHHWGTFQLTDEGIHDPVEALNAALDERHISRDRFRAMRPGEAWDVPEAT